MPGGRQKATEVAVWEDAATAEQEGAVGGEWVLLPQAMAGESGGETGGPTGARCIARARGTAYTGRCVAPTREAVYAAIDAFDEENDDMDAYINLKEFEVVGLNDVC